MTSATCEGNAEDSTMHFYNR